MNLSLDIQIADDDSDHPPPAEFERWIKAAIGDRLSEAQLSLRIVTKQEITTLNATYRGQTKTTNVLSFPAQLPDYIPVPLLGDLVICSAVVENEAKEQNKSSPSHWAHMVIHGTLHLLGYDHIDEGDAEIMENLEIDILNSLDIANPYSSVH
ncbi:MAG: rRNA maturation RNase YbeY [Spongiibacteraceae bacterium]|nr:rRNA maturation RNase YbeY [Spongiibacteraceae bacterium]